MTHSFELQINDKFRDLLDIPSEAERKELERQLIRDGGPRDALKVWDETNTLIDGHNRHAICVAHNLPFKTERLSFKDETAVEQWILENQLARRNMTPDRMTYFLGRLYNSLKQDPSKARTATDDGKATSEKLAEQFGVSERTVRRAGDIAKGADTVAKVVPNLASVKEKLAAIQNKNSETGFSKGELGEIGKLAEKDEKLAEETAKVMVAEKKQAATAKVTKPLDTKKQEKSPPPVKKDMFTVVFTKPDFEKIGWSTASEEKPAMAENCMVYIMVPDENLVNGIELLKKWGLEYEGSFVFKTDGHEGIWSDIVHTFMLVGSKGTVAGPKKASPSYIVPNGKGLEGAMISLIEAYHPKDKRLDMRKKVTAEGWSANK